LGLHHQQLSPDPDHVDLAALLYLQVFFFFFITLKPRVE